MHSWKKEIKHILFDWDHTLWDFEKNSAETLGEAFDNFDLQPIDCPSCFTHYTKELCLKMRPKKLETEIIDKLYVH